MEFEELSSRPLSGRQPRSRNRIAVDGISSTRADYVSRPAVRSRSASRAISVAVAEPAVPQQVPPTPVVVKTPAPTAAAALAPIEVAQAAEPVTPPAQVPEQQAEAPVMAASDSPKILDFTPPESVAKKKRFAKLRSKLRKPNMSVSRRLASGLALIVVVAGLGSGGISYVAAGQDGDDALLRKALTQALSVTQVHVDTSAQTSADFDFTDQKNPVISGTFGTEIVGLPAQVSGYSDIKNSYVAYKTLPSSTPPAVAQKAAGSWVKLRANGASTPGVPSSLAHAADPRYQLFGPVLFGNVPEAARKQIVDYLITHAIYDYKPSESIKDTLNGESVRRYDFHLNTSDYKVVSQSYATVSGLSPTDIQDAMTAIDGYHGADVSLYISTKSHNIVRFSAVNKGQKTVFDYSGFNKAATAAEPQTKLLWQSFAATQQQVVAQTAAKQPPAQLDILRKNQVTSLQKAFKTYQTQTGSFPSLSNINDAAWVATNLPNVDPDTLHDPLSVSSAILATPKPGALAYQVLNADGKAGCDNTAINACTQYKLTTTLSTTQQYSVTAP